MFHTKIDSLFYTQNSDLFPDDEVDEVSKMLHFYSELMWLVNQEGFITYFSCEILLVILMASWKKSLTDTFEKAHSAVHEALGLGEFVYFQKVSISFIKSVCPSIHMYQCSSH